MEAEKRGKKMMMVRLSLQCKYNISNMINLQTDGTCKNNNGMVFIRYVGRA